MIPTSTTTIRIERPTHDPDIDPLESQGAPMVVATGVRAHISTSRGREAAAGGGSQEIVYFRLSCDVVDLTRYDTVIDENTSEVYNVEWARLRRGFGLEHMEAGLNQISGVVSQPSRSDF